jgi:hypothetical protein
MPVRSKVLLSNSTAADLFLSRQSGKTPGFGSGVQQSPEAARASLSKLRRVLNFVSKRSFDKMSGRAIRSPQGEGW